VTKERAILGFWWRVIKGGECWKWQGARDSGGYGVYRGKRAHRVAWEMENGAIPEKKQVLHRCNNPWCVRVEHLYLGTDRDNANDRIAAGKRKTHCIRGHELTEENVYRFGPEKRYRQCRKCLREKREPMGPTEELS
jgi:hypothetical protein